VPGFPLAAGYVIDADVDDLIDGPWHTHLMAVLDAAENLKNRRCINNRFAGIPPTPAVAPEALGWCA
jgi:hypothetical protein